MNRDSLAYRELRSRGGVADLSRRVKLFFTGKDRVRYLNGQVTSNVTGLMAGRTQPACVTTAKGRLCAEVMITALDDALVVDAEGALGDSLPQRLERYLVADEVEIHDRTGEWRLLHLLPPMDEPMESGLRTGFGSLSHQRSRRFGRDGVDFFLPGADAEKAFAQLAGGRVVIDESLAETLRIESGIPRWGYELGEDTLPPEAGLDLTHVDYHKGCYIGQEVISRLKSVGHVNRRLTGFISDDGAPLSPGMSLFSESGSATPSGVLTSTAFSFALEKPIALGYLKRGSPSAELIARPRESAGAEIRVSVRPLPFVP